MDYLIDHWAWWFFGLLVLVGVIDELWFRWERRKVHFANLQRARAHLREELPDYIDEDELIVISNDTDEVVFEGSPSEVYVWVQNNRSTGSFDIYNRGTDKRVSTGYFMAKY